ncbi:MAG: enoyl-CoA hydratase/isomerase family protein [Bacteroidetes bacterium]|nr:enoyl-CoA hydratase/isomerase family protein [Bacteroidota bacterium]
MHTIKLYEKGAVSTVWLNRPDKHNAINPVMMKELTEAFDQLSRLASVRVIILRGLGRSFCAGADLAYMQQMASYRAEDNERDAMVLAKLFERIYTCPKPVIALLHGAVYGGANGLAAASDIVLADIDTRFAFSEVKLGITPATISPYVIGRCGEAAARDLMLTGRVFDAQEAKEFRLVNQIFTSETVNQVLDMYTGNLLHAAPGALAECKQLINDIARRNIPETEVLPDTARRIARQRASEEGQEGLKAFLEKRNPNWLIDIE